jgi:hypothetical protein
VDESGMAKVTPIGLLGVGTWNTTVGGHLVSSVVVCNLHQIIYVKLDVGNTGMQVANFYFTLKYRFNKISFFLIWWPDGKLLMHVHLFIHTNMIRHTNNLKKSETTMIG